MEAIWRQMLLTIASISFHKWPHEFLELVRYERAFVIAAVMIKLENDKKEAKKAKSRKKR